MFHKLLQFQPKIAKMLNVTKKKSSTFPNIYVACFIFYVAKCKIFSKPRSYWDDITKLFVGNCH